MQIETFRRIPFVDREEEIEFFVEWFKEVPQRILWVYGPKSSGKTTVVEYVVEKKLLSDPRYWVKYINLRGKLIASYKSFLEALIVPEDVYKEFYEKELGLKIGVFSFSVKKMKEVKEQRKNLFDALFEEFVKRRKDEKECILIIDEIQKLRDVYIANRNEERELLKEFLNFCVRLTKETHLCHVVILTSNTVFIEEIYNDARMKKTSHFYKVDHLSWKKLKAWLELERFSDEEKKLVWDYIGGCIIDILEIISMRRKGKNLKEFLEKKKWIAYTEIVNYLARGGFSEEEEKRFKEVCEEILEKGCFELHEERAGKYLPVIEKWTEKEILFYDPLELKVTGNSRIYEKGMELLLRKPR